MARVGLRRRAFTLAQAAALIVVAQLRPALELHGGLKGTALTRERRQQN